MGGHDLILRIIFRCVGLGEESANAPGGSEKGGTLVDLGLFAQFWGVMDKIGGEQPLRPLNPLPRPTPPRGAIFLAAPRFSQLKELKGGNWKRGPRCPLAGVIRARAFNERLIKHKSRREGEVSAH